jgi:phosphatidyl-myo-inositol dimannoside synthase
VGVNADRSFLALVTDAFGGYGGIAQYNRDFLNALAESGAASSITVLPRHAPQRVIARAPINQKPGRPGRFTYSAIAVVTAFCQRIDVVFCGHLYMAPLAWLIARLKGARLVLQMHGIEAWARPPHLQRIATEAADLVLCVSRYTRACVVGWAAIAPERVVVVPNTVADGFTPGDSQELRAAWGVEGKRVLLTVGRMVSCERYKGHDQVIAAIPDLVRRGLDVVYLIIGEGDDRARLEEIARDIDVVERVRFLGAVGQQCLAAVYRMADLFVMPSAGEGFGISYLEAMACGTPAIGLYAGGARDPLADGQLGTVVPETELVAVIARLLVAPRRNPAELSQAVRARFGREIFRACVGRALAEY